MGSAIFNFTGGNQSFVVPTGVTTVTADCYGSAAGYFDASTGDVARPFGGRATGSFAVTPGETLTVVVGGFNDTAGQPGFNGGGRGGTSGGGATDVRRGAAALADRLIVAGGGGGSGFNSTTQRGGSGGGLSGNDAANAGRGGTGGTQTQGGTGGVDGSFNGQSGSLGLGGDGPFVSGAYYAGGGGGGYYGGGAGASNNSNWGGGGGSSLAPAGGSTTAAQRAGAGTVTLTWNDPPSTPTSLAPSGAQGVNTVTLSAVVSDPDGSNVRAQFRVSGTVVEGSTVGSGGTSTASFAGAANTTYTLDARTVDANGAVSGYTAQQSFITNRPPTAPVVTAPNGGENINTTATVSWNAGSDPDGQALSYDVDLTTNGGTAWTNLKTGFVGTSFTHDFSAVTASTACRVRVRTKDTQGSVSAYDESNANFTIQHNQAPTAPILGNPANGSTQDLAAGYTFTYTATDPDTGDAASAWAFRRKIAGAATYEYWNAGTGVFQSTIVWNANPSGSVAFASGKWTNGQTYNWSVATKDTAGLEGPFAGDFSVVASTVAATTVTAPSGSVVDTSRPLVRWSLTQPEGNPQQTYQVRVFTTAQHSVAGFDPLTSPATWETAEIASVGAREHQVGVDLLNGQAYRAYVRAKSGNLYTAWAFSGFTQTLDPPGQPTVLVTDEPASPFGPRVRLNVQGRDNLLATTAALGSAGQASAGIAVTGPDVNGYYTYTGTAVAAGGIIRFLADLEDGAPGTYGTTIDLLNPGAAALAISLDLNDEAVTNHSVAAGAAVTLSAVRTTTRWDAMFRFFDVNVPAGDFVLRVRKVAVRAGSALAWTRGGLVGLTKFLVERSDDLGLTWEPVRDASNLTPDMVQRAVVYDYEPPRGQEVQYRAATKADV